MSSSAWVRPRKCHSSWTWVSWRRRLRSTVQAALSTRPRPPLEPSCPVKGSARCLSAVVLPTRCTWRPGVSSSGTRGPAEPVDFRRQRPREPIRRRRRERHQHRLRRRSARTRSSSARSATRRRSTSSRKSRSRPAATRPSSARRPAAWSTSSPRAARTTSAGPLFGYTQPDSLEGEWKQFQAVNGTVQTVGTSCSDAGVEGGGPIIKDRLFFFGAIDPSWQTRTFNAPPGFPLASLGDVDRKRRTMSYAAKGTVAARQRASNRRVVLRRSVARRDRPAAHVGAARATTRRRSARSTTAATTRRSATTACFGSAGCSKARSRAR